MLGHAHLHSACQLEGGLLPPALGCRHLSLLSEVAVSAACWLKGISLCCWGGLLDLRCTVAMGCHAEATASTMAACQRCCSGGQASAWLAPAACLPDNCGWPEPTCSLSCLMRHYALRLGSAHYAALKPGSPTTRWWLAAADLQCRTLQSFQLATGRACWSCRQQLGKLLLTAPSSASCCGVRPRAAGEPCVEALSMSCVPALLKGKC